MHSKCHLDALLNTIRNIAIEEPQEAKNQCVDTAKIRKGCGGGENRGDTEEAKSNEDCEFA
jgi:hypothetical protein